MSFETLHRRLGAFAKETRKVKFDRTRTSISQESEYKETLPTIRELYGRVEYWHGTGRYKYAENGALVDILQGISQEGELKPSADEWDRKREKIHVVSLAKSRMYARLYAGMYCPDAETIKNELGSRELWGYYFFGTSAIVGMFEYIPNLSQIRRGDYSSIVIPALRKKTRQWARKITRQELSFKDIFIYGTDIGSNYPILIGIKKGAVKTTHGSKFINLHEKRTEESISMSDMSHIEVPLKHHQETVALVQEAGHRELRILPIEYGEEYCRNFTFRELTSGKPLELRTKKNNQ